MKRTVIAVFLFIAINTIYAQKEIPIDISKSNITWKGFYLFYFNGHEGTVQFKQGALLKSNNKLTGGKFIIDMTTISNTDIDKEDARIDLVNHLKSDDFFSVKNYPTATLNISNIAYENATQLNLNADLTIKGITNPIRFKAKLVKGGTTLSSRFKIDRQLWGISFNYLKDGAISDAMEFNVNLYLDDD